MAVELDPLFTKLTALAPQFGRARDDIDAMVSRGKSGDYKGVMQNARLVLEAVLRSLVTDELKQTPGKAMLDELVTKFRQQANAGLVPTNILAHMGTVQAWGNLSSHDHAGSLTDSAVTVGQQEVVASLNSMVAILSWYSARKEPASVSAPPKKNGSFTIPMAIGAAALLVIGVGSKLISAPSAVAPSFEALDALYASWKEPAPPTACRKVSDASSLAKVSNDLTNLSLLEAPSAEAAYLLARATFEQRKTKSPALDKALACSGFASAEALAGRIAFSEKDLPEAKRHFEAAIAASATFLRARVGLAGVEAQLGDFDTALMQVNQVIAADPDAGPAYFIRAMVRQVKGDSVEFAKDVCRAAQLGVEEAKKPCNGLRAASP